jgi:AcrR family transcriptional regulator
MSGAPERFEPDALAGLPAELELERLPSGRHGLPSSLVSRNQRLRIVGAMLRVLPRYGYPGTTIGHLTREAGVSRAAFYEQFNGKEECFLETYDLASEWLWERVGSAIAQGAEWPVRVSGGVSVALGLLGANPDAAHLLVIEPVRVGASARKRQRGCLARFAEVLSAGRPDDVQLPTELEELLLGGALALIARYIETGRTEHLPDATAELVQYLLIPYLGSAETSRIAAEAA